MPKIKVDIPQSELPPEGIGLGKVTEIKQQNDKSRIVLEFTVSQAGEDYKVQKEYPNRITLESSWLSDIKHLTGNGVAPSDLGSEWDPAVLIGKTAPVVIAHKRGTGGKLNACVSVVLPKTFQYPLKEEVAE